MFDKPTDFVGKHMYDYSFFVGLVPKCFKYIR